MDKRSTDIVAIIPSFVESKSRLFPGPSYLVTIVGITAFLREIVDGDTRDRFFLDRVQMLHDGAIENCNKWRKVHEK